jgi:hypothetical protein
MLKSGSILDERMPEVIFYMIRSSLKGLHKRTGFLCKIILASGGKSGPDPLFQITVEIFIGVVFRGIRRKIKHFYSILMGLKPFGCDFAMMNSVIIQDQKDLPFNIHNQTGKKFQQYLGCHCLSIQHKPNFSLIGYSRDHIDTAFLGVEFNDWSFSLRSIASGVEGFVVYACFIAQ